MAIALIASGNPLKIPKINFPTANIIGEVVINITDLHPAHIAGDFSDPKYKHKHAEASSWGTAFDIDCRFLGDNPGKAVRVTFKIDPTIKYAEFMPFPLDPLDPNEFPQAVTAGNGKAQDMFADLVFNQTSASFLVLWVGYGKPAPFNLGFLCTDGNSSNLKTPVIYDPKVQNDG